MKTRQKLFLIGASGYIGKALITRATSKFDVCPTTSSRTAGAIQLDLAQPLLFDYSKITPTDTVLLTAAISSPDICAKQHEYAWSVNVTGTTEFITNAIARDARIIFFSSDTVYGEREDEFDERATCSPAGEYAVMKQEVESRFAGNPSFKTVRLSYVFSREDKFAKYLAGCAERGEEAELFHPFFRSIVHRDDVVAGALALAERWDEFPQQVINFCGPQVLSRVAFAECLQRCAIPSLRFHVSEPDDAFFKNRPRKIAMQSSVFSQLVGRPAHTLTEAVQIEFGAENSTNRK